MAAGTRAGLSARLAAERLAHALATWGGQPYAEFADEPWAAGERTCPEEIRRTARERLAAAQLRCGQAVQALADARALTREQPMYEEGWRLLALPLCARDRQGDALTALRQARHVLGEELGTAPLELEEALLHQRLASCIAKPAYGRKGRSTPVRPLPGRSRWSPSQPVGTDREPPPRC